ncbi:nitronate monooxygenase [Dyella sp. 2HG41-7]|uniref:NAD(P)H-dependent flavin oxidoreductase n=1 Tax=Dyella sp. 2HG41-7 TaxID=2883239 RepID=UPI001F32EBCE|nr:nitronate monooxygenase [Dyella sp. 2HG41-7]
MSTQVPSALLDLLGIDVPIVQAPMAGVSSPAMAAAVSTSGGLGSLGVGAMNASKAREAIHEFRRLSGGPLNVNVFVHRPAHADKQKASAWLARLQPEFDRWNAKAPQELHEIYTSFLVDNDMLAMLVEEKPRAVSFHFGVPHPHQIQALHDAGIVLLASATNQDEAKLIEAAGIDAVVAQGYEAGGHRGVFDPDIEDSQLGTFALTRLLVRAVNLPIIAAGGIMDGAGIASALSLGAQAAQLGTAFVATDESLADAGYRERLFSAAAHHTTMTRVISGRPARSLANDFTQWGSAVPNEAIPDYPIAYDVGKALHAAGKAADQSGYGAQWAGQGAPLARALSSAALMQALKEELVQAERSVC